VHDPWFFIDSPLAVPSDGSPRPPIVLSGGDAHHLTVVRRARAGDRVCVSDGAGTIVEGRLASLSPSAVEVEAVAERQLAKPAPAVRVLQGLAKGAKVDLIVQKLVELGVDEIVIFTSGRSVPRWDARKRAQMAARWATIAREAAKQSRRAWLPQTGGPVTAADAALMARSAARSAARSVEGLPDGALVLLADESSAVPLRDVLRPALTQPCTVVVGPEGGLTPAEREAFGSAGAVPFSLGPQILRTETAALAAAALILHHAGRLG